MAQLTIPPLTRALLAFAAGLAAARSPLLPEAPLLWAAALALFCCVGLVLLRGKPTRQFLPAFLLALLFLFCGILFAHSHSFRALPAHHLAHFAQEKLELSLTCRLIDKPVRKNGRLQITVEAESVLLPSGAAPLPASGRARLTINAPDLAGLVPGRFYQVRCRLARPRSAGTPGAFDHAVFLAARNILVTGWVAHPVFIQPVSSFFHNKSGGWYPAFIFEKLRQDIEEFLAANLEPNRAGLYKALLIGDRSGLDPHVLENFKAAGVMHLLAISGMHLGVLAFLTTIFFTRLSRCFPRLYLHLPAFKICLGLSLPLLFFYAGLAGFQPPVLRAFLMTAVFIGAMLCDRQWSSLNNVAIAAFFILLLNPLSIQTASFQLSFAATTAIVLVTPRLTAWQKLAQDTTPAVRARHLLVSAVLVSMTAFVATAPLALHHFNRISLLSPFSTLLLSPLLCFWALPLGLIAIVLQPLLPSLAGAVLQAGVLGLDFSRTLADLLADLPLASLWLPTPTITALLAAYSLIFIMFRTKQWWKMVLAFACLALLLTGVPWQGIRDGNLQISYLDVGQGSATVIRMPDGTITLIDGGGPSSEVSNVGESIIAPFLWQEQTRRIDQIILTHAHADHFNGLPFLMRKFRPHTLWVSQKTDPNPEFQALLAEARQADCQVRIARSEEVLVAAGTEGGTDIRCIANLAEADNSTESNRPGPSSGNANNLGLILRLTHGEHTFLFPGDIEREREGILMREKGRSLGADVLLMPHHGLRSSGSVEFLEAVSPGYIVVSRGGNSAWQTTESLAGTPATCYTTLRHGSIFITSDKREITIRTHYDPVGP